MWASFERALAGETTIVERRLALSHCPPRDYEITFRPETDEDGHVERVIALSVDVTAYRERERDLMSERRKAERASRAKTSFLAAMSHELRTPLNAIIGYADVMRLGMFGPLSERYQGYADDIHKSGSFLRDLVGDLLELSRLEGGADDLQVEAVSAADLVEETSTVLGHPERLQVEVDDRAVVLADRRAAVQCLMNVCDNALKYSDSAVQVSAVSGETDVRFEVRDWGPGVDPDEIAFLTEPFWQAERRNPGIAKDGVSIGLAIVRRLVEAQGGDLSIDLPNDGGLRVTLALSQAADGLAVPVPV
jgi:signal transduction histidine kinase